jgi:hypothetical protein
MKRTSRRVGSQTPLEAHMMKFAPAVVSTESDSVVFNLTDSPGSRLAAASLNVDACAAPAASTPQNRTTRETSEREIVMSLPPIELLATKAGKA